LKETHAHGSIVDFGSYLPFLFYADNTARMAIKKPSFLSLGLFAFYVTGEDLLLIVEGMDEGTPIP
jgi:hypothetical protein